MLDDLRRDRMLAARRCQIDELVPCETLEDQADRVGGQAEGAQHLPLVRGEAVRGNRPVDVLRGIEQPGHAVVGTENLRGTLAEALEEHRRLERRDEIAADLRQRRRAMRVAGERESRLLAEDRRRQHAGERLETLDLGGDARPRPRGVRDEDPDGTLASGDRYTDATHRAVLQKERDRREARLGAEIVGEHGAVLQHVASLRERLQRDRRLPDEPRLPPRAAPQEERLAVGVQLEDGGELEAEHFGNERDGTFHEVVRSGAAEGELPEARDRFVAACVRVERHAALELAATQPFATAAPSTTNTAALPTRTRLLVK